MAEPCPVLPDHVIEDVLARLSAKSLLRCRCLSRAWAATLSSDDFADRHLRLANRHGGPRILILQGSRSGDAPPKIQAWSPDHPGGMMLMDVPHVLRRRHFCPPSLFKPLGAYDQRRRKPGKDDVVPCLVTQQCRGLVILEATGTEVYFTFNPSTGQMAALPEGRATGCRRHAAASLGIGYDMLIKKHKVVRIYYRGSDAKKLQRSAGCEVYVINSTGLWSPANGGAPPGWVSRNDTSVFVQGRVHWMAKSKLDASSNEMFIITFSLGDETFGTVPLPLGMGTERNSHQLTELDGCLCLFSTQHEFSRSPKRYYYVWLLRGHGETSTWDLHYRIDLDMLSPKVASFMRMGEKVSPLAMINNSRRVVLVQARLPTARIASFGLHAYAPATGYMENLMDNSGLVSNKHMEFGHAMLYEESITYPGQPREDIIFAMSLVLGEL